MDIKIVAPIAGALLGFLYYRFVGCSSGTCPITSTPYGSIAYGMLVGLILTMK